MPSFLREHIRFSDRTERLRYLSNSLGRSRVEPREIDRTQHGQRIRNQFNEAVQSYSRDEDSDFVYLVFKSAIDFLLDLEKFEKSECRLASYKRIKAEVGNETLFYYEATVYLNRRAISKFLRKVEKFLTGNSPNGHPLNRMLISNIDQIRAATLESFWQEPELLFPEAGQEVWWEVWLSREQSDNNENPIESISVKLQEANVEIGNRFLKFPEHWVYLLRGSVESLGASLLYTDKLAEIRKPKETADFFTYLTVSEQHQLITDLRSRVDNHQGPVSVCLLDTGVNRGNPLLENIVAERNLDAVNPSWQRVDLHPGGHGTPMAGLALYGDLTEALASSERIQIYHHLESITLVNPQSPHDPTLYGAVTQEAVARGITLNPTHKRVVCMAVTSKHLDKGRPSSWSSAVDQTVYGSVEEPNDDLLFFISAGNTEEEEWINYPLANDDHSIHDPAQSFNAIAVGAYTLKDRIDNERHPGATLLCQRGAMAACNSTSVNWDKDWSRKPDIVMEGGNKALQNNGIIGPDSLQLLAPSKGGTGRSSLTLFSDTSAATALASKFAAELYHHYPSLWPETIRALIIHSADWTQEMLGNRTIDQLSPDEKIKLIQRVGYGVPNMQKARYSANNSLCRRRI